MYDYRKWTPEKQAAALKVRVAHGIPLHCPPHVAEPDAVRDKGAWDVPGTVLSAERR